jgi:hypothetical protein
LIGIDLLKPSPRAWAVVVSVWVVGLAALLTWVLRTPAPVLREQLKILQFWSLETCVFLGLAVSTAALQGLPRLLERRDIFRVALLMALAFGLTVGWRPGRTASATSRSIRTRAEPRT